MSNYYGATAARPILGRGAAAAGKPIDSAIQTLATPRKYIVHNATDETIEVSWDGETRSIPPYNEYVEAHFKYADVPCSALDANGNIIPGTMIFSDIYGVNDLGGENLVWSAVNALVNVLGIEIKTGKCHGAYAQRGLSILPENPTPEIVENVRQAGRARYDAWKLQECRDIVESYTSKSDARAARGMTSAPPGPEYHKARMFLQVAEDKMKKQIEGGQDLLQVRSQVIDLETANPDPLEAAYEAAQVMPEQVQIDDDAELDKMVAEKAQELAAKLVNAQVGIVNPEKNKTELAHELLQDPEFLSAAIDKLRWKYKIRKLPAVKKAKV